MYKVDITNSTAVSANTAIAFNPVRSTNDRVSYKDGIFTFNKPGAYEVRGIINCTGVSAGNIKAQVMAKNVALADTVVGDTSTATTDLITLPITTTLFIDKSPEDEFAEISIQLTAAATISNANVTIAYVR